MADEKLAMEALDKISGGEGKKFGTGLANLSTAEKLAVIGAMGVTGVGGAAVGFRAGAGYWVPGHGPKPAEAPKMYEVGDFNKADAKVTGVKLATKDSTGLIMTWDQVKALLGKGTGAVAGTINALTPPTDAKEHEYAGK